MLQSNRFRVELNCGNFVSLLKEQSKYSKELFKGGNNFKLLFEQTKIFNLLNLDKSGRKVKLRLLTLISVVSDGNELIYFTISNCLKLKQVVIFEIREVIVKETLKSNKFLGKYTKDIME